MKKGLTVGIHRPVKIQIVSRDFPFENSRGNITYVLDFMRYLRQRGCEIEYVVLDSAPNGKTPWCIIPSTVAALASVSARNHLRFGRVLLRFSSLSEWFTGLMRLAYNQLPKHLKNIYRSARHRLQQMRGHLVTPQIWQVPATPEEVAFASAQFVRFKPGVVIANYAFLGNVLDALSPHHTVLKAILTIDVRHQRTALFKEVGVAALESDWDWETETLQLLKAQVLLAIQEEDARVLKEMVPQCEVICMPISAVCHSHTVKQVRGRCLFVGSNADHNIHGIQWFLKNIWPIISQSVSNCSLHICGSVCDQIQETFPNVRLLGRVDNLKPEYSNAEVCLVPLPVGSGLKIKLVEALSYGRACVSTSVGVQGLREIAGSAALVANTTEDFAAAVLLLLTNPGKRQWMEEQACRYVRERLSPEAVYQPFVERIVRTVGEQGRLGTPSEN